MNDETVREHDERVREHIRIKNERSRYKIVRTMGAVNENRRDLQDERNFDGDLVEEYYDNKKIRDHRFIFEDRIEEPDRNMSFWAEREGIILQPKKSRVAKFDTTLYIDEENIDVPDVIIHGKWTNPTNQQHYVPTHRQGDWGIYAEDYTDDYTNQHIKSWTEHCSRILKEMKNAIDTLNATPIQINKKGALDNISKLHDQYKKYIDDCKLKITTAKTILESAIVEPPAMAGPTVSVGIGQRAFYPGSVDGLLCKLNTLV
jgi:hypothetical protein